VFLTSFNNIFTFFMVASVPVPALRSFSLQVCADRIKETNVVSNDSCHSCRYQPIGFVSENINKANFLVAFSDVCFSYLELHYL